MISLGVATVIYLALFPFVGYLSIPIGVVVSGYVKNHLLRRVCHKRDLIKTDKKTVWAVLSFILLSGILGFGLYLIPMRSVYMMGALICCFAVLYLPIAYIIDRRLIK